jgi:DNA-binding NarL/FixJ family response regulator
VSDPIRVLVVDDHSVVREGIRHVLEGAEGFLVVAEAANGAEALDRATAERPDIVLLDLSMPGISGLDVVRQLRVRLPDTRVLILSVHDDREYVLESVRVGAHGYLRKDSSPADIRRAIRVVMPATPSVHRPRGIWPRPSGPVRTDRLGT